MKKFLLLCLVFVPCAAVAAKNKISMVTYFPVPYVAYSQINAEQIDAGLTGTCDMKLGCDESSVPLSVNTVNLRSGRLDLNGGLGIKGNSLELGSGSGAGHIAFQNVRIQTGAMQSVHAGSVNVEELSLFGKKFPSCKAVNAAGNGKMQWQSLKLAGAAGNELYLVCGDAAAAASGDCSLASYKSEHKSECCPSAPYTDTTCWKAVAKPEEWEWGVPTTISGRPCTGKFYVTDEKPSNSDATHWCMNQENIQWASSRIPGVDDITFTLAGGSVAGGGCSLKQPNREGCNEGEAYFSDGNQTGYSRNYSCTISGKLCTCTYNTWTGVPCIKKHDAYTSYEPNGW